MPMCVQVGLHTGGRGRQRVRGSKEVSVRDMETKWNCALFVALCAYRHKIEQQ